MNHACDNLVWLGVVPNHWKVLKLRQILSPVSEKNHPDLPLLSVVREKGVIVRNIEDKEENHNHVPDDLSGYKLVKIGQFAMNKMKAWQGSYGVSRFDGIVSPAYFVFDIQCDINIDFFNRAIRSIVYVNYFGQASDGIRVGQWDLSMQRMKEIPFLLPPRPEQDQIVRFLDWKISSINRLINIKREKIIELKSLKRSVVNHVVTHGLNPDVAMKNSGVSWLGKIPAHWEVLALKRMCSMKSGDNLTNLEIIDNDRYKVYGGNGIRGFFHRFNCENECVLIGRQGALCGNVHLVTERVWATDHAVITKAFGTISTKYLYYLLMAMNLNQYGQSTAAQPGISIGVIKNLPACLPPRIEQDQIVTYLEATNENYDKVAQILDAKITALLELKARLISDVVTGKIDVRGIEIPEYGFAEETDLVGESDEQNYENIKEEEE